VAEVSPHAQLAMQAALQTFVDNAISKTITVPADFEYKQFCSLYQDAYHLGLKGCTTFRPNPVTGAVLLQPAETVMETTCCARPERGS
jgi:ribonucleoside-diphosphate reductase alpha chain